MPAAFRSFLAKRAIVYGALWTALAERPDRTSTAIDGTFHFVDLPDGAYTVTFSAPTSVGRYGSPQVDFTVARDAEGKLVTTMTIVCMPPSGARGLVSGPAPGSAPTAPAVSITGARVRVRGSGELAYSDVGGRFYLPGLETGTLTLEITASNYEPVTTPVIVVGGTITDVGTVTLVPTTL
ncbi:hypothetical protein A7982_13695 [Minicystis rosea]|nr:hypothetical protein A7982_13695 [Minicystis rosea]